MFMTPEQILSAGGKPVGTDVLDPTNTKVHWKQCLTCRNIMPFSKFKRDASYREGVRDRCIECESAPCLSTEEHVERLREANYFSAGTQRQRWMNQEDYENVAARLSGRWMHCSEFINRIRGLIPDLFVMDGRIVGDVSVYRTFGRKQKDGTNYSYLGFLPFTNMPEWSVYEFNERDVPVRERIRGWRTPLERWITQGILSEQIVNRVFGEPRGLAATAYRRHLYKWRNRCGKS